LFGSEESAVPVIKIHLLFVALAVMRNPEFLGIGFETDVNKSEGKDESDSESSDKNKEAIVVVESCNFLKDELKVHCFLV
jgi:hypothetical protein